MTHTETNGQAKPEWKQLNVAIIGGGLGGMAAAVALRRAGHKGELSTAFIS